MGGMIKPSTEKDAYWLNSASLSSFYSTELSGKWCIISDVDEVDSLWAKISRLTELGTLLFAKTSTAGGHTENNRSHVICVYTRDYRDTSELMRTREHLREAGVNGLLRYKRDIDTLYPPSDPGLEFFYVEFR